MLGVNWWGKTMAVQSGKYPGESSKGSVSLLWADDKEVVFVSRVETV